MSTDDECLIITANRNSHGYGYSGVKVRGDGDKIPTRTKKIIIKKKEKNIL